MAEGLPGPPARDPPATPARALELTAEGLRRRFLLVVPASRVAALHAVRLRELGLDAAPEAPAPPPGASAWAPQVRARVAASALEDACRQAAQDALDSLLRRLPIRPWGSARFDILAGPPDGDLILRAEFWTMPDIAPPDPSALRVERLVAEPDPDEVDRALLALAASRGESVELAAGEPARPGDEVVCDVSARLLPAENRIPQAGVSGAKTGTPGRLPDGWSFGDNGAGLSHEVLEVDAVADPPHIRLRVFGTTQAEGQSYVIFHAARAIPAGPGAMWVGSVAVRPVGEPAGLRASKLRLQSQPASGEGSLRRKDAALTLRAAAGFVRCHVSDKLVEPDTAFLRMPLLFDHAAGAVDFSLDIAAPRLVEGLDLGQDAAVPLPEFSGRGQRFRIGEATDALGLAPHLAGIGAGESREVTLRLPRGIEDRALAGREALFAVRALAVRRRATACLDDALAAALGFAGLEAMRGFVAGRVAERHARLSEWQAQAALLDALVAAAGEIPLSEAAVRAEFAQFWTRLSRAAESRNEPPPSREKVLALVLRRLRIALLLGAVARRHGLAPDEAELRRAAAASGAGADREAVRRQAIEACAIAFLMRHAQITERRVPAAELRARAGE